MSRSFVLITFILFCVALFFVSSPKEEKYVRTNIVTTFSILEDITKNIVGNHPKIHIKSIVPLYTDPHTYQPRPQDAKVFNNADIVIVNGWGFEGWLDKFIVASEFKGRLITATNNIKTRNN